MTTSVLIAALLLAPGFAQRGGQTVRLAGRVVADDAPVTASTAKFRLPIQVRLTNDGRSQTVAVGADGSFEFLAVRPGQYSLSAPEFSFPPQRVDVAGADIIDFRFKLPVIRAVGRVLDPEDRPVPDARVSFIRDKEFSSHEACKGAHGSPECYEAIAKDGAISAEGLSGADGRFEIPVLGGLTNDSAIRVDAKDARGISMSQGWPVSPNRKLYPPDMGDIELYRWRELRVVIQAEGRPLAGAQVDFGGSKEVSGKDGVVRYGLYFYSALVGVQLLVRADGYAMERRDLGLPPEGSRMTVDLSRDTPVDGRVVDRTGQPVPDSTVTLRSPDLTFYGVNQADPRNDLTTVRTNGEGRFSLQGLKSGGKYRLEVTPRADLPLVPTSVELIGGPTPLEVRLESAGEVLVNGEYPSSVERSYDRAAFERSRNGAPRSLGSPIGLEHQDLNGAWRRIDVQLRVEQAQPGRFQVRFTQVPPGPTRVIIEGWSGVAADASRPFQVFPGGPASVALQIVMARSLRVAVVDDRGNPVANARVAWPLPQAGSSSYMQTNDMGWVDINVNPTRELSVKVTAPDHSEMNHTISAGTSSPVTIVLPDGR